MTPNVDQAVTRIARQLMTAANADDAARAARLRGDRCRGNGKRMADEHAIALVEEALRCLRYGLTTSEIAAATGLADYKTRRVLAVLLRRRRIERNGSKVREWTIGGRTVTRDVALWRLRARKK